LNEQGVFIIKNNSFTIFLVHMVLFGNKY